MKLMIGEKILALRKAKGYTQEDLARALHVSCAAVSKWETQTSYPDITLLQPLARLFEISLDELLEFSQKLSDNEIKDLQDSCHEEFKKGDIEKAYKHCECLIREYPNCDLLLFSIASLYNYQYLVHPEYKEIMKIQLQNRSLELLIQLQNSPNDYVNKSAKILIATIYQHLQEYDKALELMKSLVPSSYDVRLNLASLYHLKNEDNEAIQITQQVIIRNFTQLMQAMTSLSTYKKDDEISYKVMKDLEALSNIFKFSPMQSMAILVKIEYYAKIKDKEVTLSALNDYLDSQILLDMNASIYTNQIKFSQDNLDNHHIINQFINNEESLDFLREEPLFKELLDKAKMIR